MSQNGTLNTTIERNMVSKTLAQHLSLNIVEKFSTMKPLACSTETIDMLEVQALKTQPKNADSI